jgi:purine-binding chemotaxis protein CheW
MNTVAPARPLASTRAALAGKYMTFKLASEEYGVEILKVRELIGLLEITRVPGTRPFVKGLINLRGKVIPVIDLRLKFGMSEGECTGQNVIIVVQLGTAGRAMTMGILVDEVLEVRAIQEDAIAPTPDFHSHDAVDFILGIGKAEKRIIFLLDIDRVLSSTEQNDVEQTII